MSLDKAIKYGKEHRKPYKGGKAIDKTCRNHGGCPACLNNRFHSINRDNIKVENQLKDYMTN